MAPWWSIPTAATPTRRAPTSTAPTASPSWRTTARPIPMCHRQPHRPAVNDAPVAQDGSPPHEDTPLTGTSGRDRRRQPASPYSLGSPAGERHVVVNPDGSYTYTPRADFNGSDSFTFMANDGAADSECRHRQYHRPAVNDAPVAQDGNASATRTHRSPALWSRPISTAPARPSPRYPGGAWHCRGQPGRQFTYTPNANFNGSDSFTFMANDGAADSNAATISLAILLWPTRRISISTATTRPPRRPISPRPLPAPTCQSRTPDVAIADLG